MTPFADTNDEDGELPPVPEGASARDLPIINRRGLHARASAKFVQTVEKFGSDVTVSRGGETVGGRSIMGLLTLGAAQGTSIRVTALGPDQDSCMEAITALLANRFGEDE
ncbi:HPr family phosphocarrier protein [Methylobacterium indicum]|uniref:Phosphocarrier protein HPr n=1 Tax=Methylobacterium indicum TaxID=1775910 RepID=A0A8H8WSB3_9HYPH|nr:HPr family phosphocarrier protein [Methylobacterium indicum]BCM83367.1 phosphocarrier protein HPr [Methylobacterium indicum]